MPQYFKAEFKIESKGVGGSNRCFIIAEMSNNHNRSFETAVKMLEEAKKAGVDALKLQTYTSSTLTIKTRKGEFLIPKKNQFAGPKSLYDLYDKLYMPWEWQLKLKKIANKNGLILISSAYDPSAVKFLNDQFKTPAIKIASFEMNDDGLLIAAAKTKKPVIMSTGMATLEEIDHAVNVLRENGCLQLAVLRCASAYPARYEDTHLENIKVLHEIYQLPVGLSDHTLGVGVPVAAVALGAKVIEKHFTLDKTMEGPDHRFSMDPTELKLMVESIRQAEKAMNGVSFDISSENEHENTKRFRRSLYIIKKMKKGDILTNTNLRSIRPGGGLAPKYKAQVLGIRVARAVDRGTPLTWELLK